MKLLITTLAFLSLGNLLAEAANAPVPKAIILHSTNQPARLSVVLLRADKWRGTSPKSQQLVTKPQQLIVTNPQLLCLNAGSATAKKEDDTISLIFHGVTAYGPFVQKGDYGNDQTLETRKLKEYVYSLREDDMVQINGELLTAESIWQRYKSETKKRK